MGTSDQKTSCVIRVVNLTAMIVRIQTGQEKGRSKARRSQRGRGVTNHTVDCPISPTPKISKTLGMLGNFFQYSR